MAAEPLSLPAGHTAGMVDDPYQLYTTERHRLVEQLRHLTPAQVGTTVPACPAWTVKDVVAHLSGLVAETLARVPPPRGSDEATARQVGDRADSTLVQILHEWETNTTALGPLARTDPVYTMALTSDLVVHGHDIAEALGLPIDRRSRATVMAADRYLALLQERAAEQLDLALTVNLVGVGVRAAHHEMVTAVRLDVDPFTFLRCVTGRRTRAEVEALAWSGDPSLVISTCFGQYGPLANEAR